jgi:hypothetical protein
MKTDLVVSLRVVLQGERSVFSEELVRRGQAKLAAVLLRKLHETTEAVGLSVVVVAAVGEEAVSETETVSTVLGATGSRAKGAERRGEG